MKTNLLTKKTKPKFLTFLLAAMLVAGTSLCSSAYAQSSTTTLYDSDTYSNEYVPMYSYYGDNGFRSQVLYFSSDLSDLRGTTITSLTFYVFDGDDGFTNATITVKMFETSSTYNSSNFQTPPLGCKTFTTTCSINSADEVVITIPGGFELSSSTTNLCVDFYTSGSGTAPSVYFYGDEDTGTYASNYSFGCGETYPTTGTRQVFGPKTTFTYTGGGGSGGGDTPSGNSGCEFTVTLTDAYNDGGGSILVKNGSTTLETYTLSSGASALYTFYPSDYSVPNGTTLDFVYKSTDQYSYENGYTIQADGVTIATHTGCYNLGCTPPTDGIIASATVSCPTYTVTIARNNTGYGTVSQSSVTDVPSGTSVSTSGNELYIGSTTVTATPASQTAQYTYSFSSWSNASGTITADRTITANFSRSTRQYTITWKKEDGSSTLETDSNQNYGATTAYNSSTPTKASTAQYDYTFDGWATSANGPKAYDNGSTPTVSGAATYYAHFSATTRQYTITWKNEDGSSTLETDSNQNYGAATAYNSSTPTKASTAQYTYTFDGWTTSANGGGTYYANGLTPTVSGAATYYAHFTATTRQYTITWKNEAGTSTLETDSNQSYGSATTYNSPTPTKASTAQYTYTFDGWATSANGPKAYDNGSTPTVSGAATYYAHFSATTRKYTVTWKNYDNSVLETDENVEYGTTPTYDDSTPTHAADAQYTYSFTGWSPAVSSVTGDATYTAQFSSAPQIYTVTLHTNDGTINAGNVTSYTYGTGATLPTNVTKSGYTFGGWYDNSGLSGDAVTAIPNTETGNKEYWAKWTPSSFTLTYSASPSAGGTVTVQNSGVDVSSGSLVAGGTSLSISATPNEGYVFSSWSVTGTGASVGSSSTASTTLIMGSGDCALTAIFARNTISDKSGWEAFCATVNGGYNYSDQTVTLNADIDLTGYTGGPVGTSEHPFSGTFNGNGHTIKNYSSSATPDNGLFGYTSGAIIHDLVVSATLSGSSTNAGIVVGTLAAGTMYNVAAVGSISSTDATNIGGLVGSNAGSIYNCYSNATTLSGTNKGGLAGINTGTIKNCYANGISSGIYAFAYNNTSGTISDCYANATGSGYKNSGNDPTGHGTYSATVGIKDKDYMYRDNAVTLASGTISTTYTSGHIISWPGLVSVLNRWVDGNKSSGVNNPNLASWFRPLTANINGDLPILGFANATSVGTSGDAKLLDYGGLDALLGGSATSIFLYGNETSVSRVPIGSQHVYVNENAVLKQSGSSDFINTTVGVTFDNSSGNAHDYWGNRLEYDWHLMSTPLSDAAIGATYETTGTYTSSSGANINGLSGSYFPNSLITEGNPAVGGSIKWDLYTYYEPAYHWINFKRSKDNHWYSDRNAHIDYTGADYASDAATNNFIPGKGYMMAISQNTFMNQTGTLNKGNVTITLTKNDNYSPGANLVGNPYQAYLDLEAVITGTSNNITTFYVYDAEMDNYIAYTKGATKNAALPSRYIHPHQGFFVVAPNDDYGLTFTPEMATADTTIYSYLRGDEVNYPLVNLFAENEIGQRDLAVIEFHHPEVGGAEKMDALNNAPFCLSAHHDRTDYAILFATDDINRVPVHFKTAEDGQMTLTWETYNGQFNSLHLVDNITGVNYDMLTHDSYTFNASVEDYSARFYITYDCSGTGIEENDDNDGASTGSATFAYINNGNIVIDGVETCHGASLQVIDVMGRVMYSTVCTDGVHTVSTNGFAKGVYLLRLADSKQVRVQKIMVP